MTPNVANEQDTAAHAPGTASGVEQASEPRVVLSSVLDHPLDPLSPDEVRSPSRW